MDSSIVWREGERDREDHHRGGDRKSSREDRGEKRSRVSSDEEEKKERRGKRRFEQDPQLAPLTPVQVPNPSKPPSVVHANLAANTRKEVSNLSTLKVNINKSLFLPILKPAELDARMATDQATTIPAAIDSVLIPPIIPPPLVPPPVAPPFVPILTPSIPPRPLAPIPVPVRPPPGSRPPVPPQNNGEARDSGSVVSDNAQYQVSEQTRLAKERQEKAMQEFLIKRRLRLRQARLEITKYALERADSCLQRARRRRGEDSDAEIDFALYQAEGLDLEYCSAIGDDRPLSGCSFSYDGTILATCYLSGVAKLWSMPQMTKISTLRGHTERATDVAFSPTDNYNNYVATASADRTARIWNSRGDFLRAFEGHLDRLARTAFHPSGKYLGTTSFDKTWRLWDVETGDELLLQEGHSRGVYGISFHPDGSLVATCGLDALTRVWDLRTGKSILALEGHVKPVLGVSFSPNGYHLASGGEDNTCRIWDLRKKNSVYVIPAHSKLISQVKFEPRDGYSLVTASHDMTAKVWSSRGFMLVKTLAGHEAIVSSLDVTGHGHCVATVSHDRTIKLWSSV